MIMCASARSRSPIGEIISCSRRCCCSVGCVSLAPPQSSWSRSTGGALDCSCGTTTSSSVAASRNAGCGGSGFSSRNGLAVSACSISCANSSADIWRSFSACWTCGVSVRCCRSRNAIAGPMNVLSLPGNTAQTMPACLRCEATSTPAPRCCKSCAQPVAITARGRALCWASRMADRLERYREMRDFSITPEPRGRKVVAKKNQLRYFIQRHAATRLHYDFRLELEGVLKSWAVPKGPSFDPADKRLAMQTEDHPLDYGDFEGVIPEKQYGAGEVLLWDQGAWMPEDRDPLEALRKGRLHCRLDGEKLRGAWA